MNLPTAALLTTLAITAAVLLYANRHSPGNTAETIADDQGSATQPKAQKKTQFRSPGKPGASISMNYTIDEKPTPDRSSKVNITYRSTTSNADNLSVVITMDSGLVLLNGDTLAEFSMSGVNTEAQQTLLIQPTQSGEYFINIQASLISDGRTRYRSFAIPIDVPGDSGIRHSKSSQPERDHDGNPIIRMTAEEL